MSASAVASGSRGSATRSPCAGSTLLWSTPAFAISTPRRSVVITCGSTPSTSSASSSTCCTKPSGICALVWLPSVNRGKTKGK